MDFKRLNFTNSSQPYTPSYSLFTNNLMVERQKGHNSSEGSQHNDGSSFIGSLGSSRMGGMIRATQNSYMSQEEQVFTMLASQN